MVSGGEIWLHLTKLGSIASLSQGTKPVFSLPLMTHAWNDSPMICCRVPSIHIGSSISSVCRVYSIRKTSSQLVIGSF
jgi:hypothetical protein